MTPISKEKFMVILKRQQESGLSVKDFCENQSYTASSFNYWKSKFGLTRPYNNHASETAVEKLDVRYVLIIQKNDIPMLPPEYQKVKPQ